MATTDDRSPNVPPFGGHRPSCCSYGFVKPFLPPGRFRETAKFAGLTVDLKDGALDTRLGSVEYVDRDHGWEVTRPFSLVEQTDARTA